MRPEPLLREPLLIAKHQHPGMVVPDHVVVGVTQFQAEARLLAGDFRGRLGQAGPLQRIVAEGDTGKLRVRRKVPFQGVAELTGE